MSVNLPSHLTNGVNAQVYYYTGTDTDPTGVIKPAFTPPASIGGAVTDWSTTPPSPVSQARWIAVHVACVPSAYLTPDAGS